MIAWDARSRGAGARRSDEQEHAPVWQLRTSGLRVGRTGSRHGGKHHHFLSARLSHRCCRNESGTGGQCPAHRSNLGCGQRSADRLAVRSHKDAVGTQIAVDGRQRGALSRFLSDLLAGAGFRRTRSAMAIFRLLSGRCGALQHGFDDPFPAAFVAHGGAQPRLR